MYLPCPSFFSFRFVCAILCLLCNTITDIILIFAMSKVNNSGWYALVKYKSGNKTEVLPVHKIRMKVGKGERIAFNPKSLTDFDKKKFYIVNTAHGSENGKEHKWYALIGMLAESQEALEYAMSVKRISWPIMSDDESEPISTDDAVLNQASPSSMIISINRELNKNKIKKDATDAVHAKLLASRNLNPNNVSLSIIDDGTIVTQLLQENEELKSALKTERERNNSPREVRDNTLQECLQRIEEKVEKMQANFHEKLDNTGKVNLEKFAELEKK